MFEKEIIVDGRGHLVGRLASKIAHQLLVGQKIVVVRCEMLVFSGSLFRNNITFHEFLNKAHKTTRGKAALQRLKVFEGMPYPYDTKKRMVVPQALKVLRIKSFRNTCLLGDLMSMNGWKRKDIVEKLEGKRKAKSQIFWEKKQKRLAAKKKVMNDPKCAKMNEELKKFGF